MMKRNSRRSVCSDYVLLTVSMVLSLSLSNLVSAADCPAIRARVKQEKGVIQRNKILQEAIEKCADDQQVNYFYAYNLERLRKYDQALIYYQQAARLDQQHAKSYFGIGDTQLALGHPAKAITAFEKGLSISPQNIWAKRSLKQAQLLLQKNNSSSARTDTPVLDSSIPPPVPVTEPGVADGHDESRAPIQTTAAQRTNNIQIAKLNKVMAADDITEKPARKKNTNSITYSPLNIPVHFAMNSSELNTGAIEVLDQVICPALLATKGERSIYELAGHTDNKGSFEVNMNISRNRVHSVRDHLITHCEVEPGALQVVYYGQTRPKAPNTTRENMQLNRRVEIRRIR